MISIDTLRADHLGSYGYERDTSPSLDSLRKDGVLFRQAIAHAPSTLPSHASMMSSLLPHEHQALYSRRAPIPDHVTTLAEVLRSSGYRTAGFHGGGQMAAELGMGQGFEIYTQESREEELDRWIEWLSSVRKEAFFLFLHTYEVHHPYTPSPKDLVRFARPRWERSLPDSISLDLLREINKGERELGPADEQHLVDAYDAEIFAFDRKLGELFSWLRESGLYDTTMIVVTSDHGEEFGEHGTWGWHWHTLYDELLRVPLVIKFRDQKYAGREVPRQVRLIDLAPTILASLDLPRPEAFRGVSLLPLVRGESVTGTEVAISYRDLRDLSQVSARSEDWKWIDGRLYDLRADAGEQLDVAEERPEIASSLEAEIRANERNFDASRGEDPVRLEEETEAQLKALGYIED